MMLYDNMLRTGLYLRKHKKFLPYIFIISLGIAIFITHPFDIVKSNGLLTMICFFMFLLSVLIRFMAKRTDAEHLPDFVEAKGIYSIVRYPVYISNFLMVLALSLYMGIMWYFVFISFLAVLVTERIVMHQENCQKNKYGLLFRKWSKTTGAVVPYLLNWQGAANSKDYIYTVKQISLFCVSSLAIFTMISFIKNRLIDFTNKVSVGWLVAFTLAFIVHIVLHKGKLMIKKPKANSDLN